MVLNHAHKYKDKKMATSTDVATVRLQTYLNLPLVQRCKEIALLIDESSTTELQHVFPALIDSLFGITDNMGWGLHNISLKKYPQEYEALCVFLSPQGPVFSLCYKLLPDCYLKYNFPVSFLPGKIRSMLEEGIIPPFYFDKIRDEQSTRAPSALCMNPFEYYIFHFAYHLTNPWLQLQQQENVWINWETVYVQLAHSYLYHFLPRDHSPVLPIIGPYVKKTPQRKLLQSPDSKRLQMPRLLRSSILNPASQTPQTGVSQQQCLPQVWRSETVVQVFLDFWLEYTEDQSPSQLNTTYATSLPQRHSIHSGEHIRLVRAFIKTLHEFANSTIGDKSAMDELKRIILPSVQGKIYSFLRKAIHHWPLDSSFRLILEAWLSFIQPWRYVPNLEYIKHSKSEDEEKGKIQDETRWISFVANNLLAYTAIFQQLLPRFMRTDLVAPKNALMLFRVTKVFDQPHLANMIKSIESQWTPIVRQQIIDLEGQNYQYVPLFSPTTLSQVSCFLSSIKQAHLTATSLIEALETRRSGRRFLYLLWEFFNGEESSSDDVNMEDRRKVPVFLANAQQQLRNIFQLEDFPQEADSMTADQEYHESILSTSFHHQSQMDFSLDASRPGVFVPRSFDIQKDGRQTSKYIEYLGDPELLPIRSNECALLARYLFKLSTYINEQYETEIGAAFYRPGFIGKICRQILIPPTTVVKLPKRTPNGISPGGEKRLQPRLSLRLLANKSLLSTLGFGIFVSWASNFGIFYFLLLLFMFWFVNIIARATVEPWFQQNQIFRSNNSFERIN
ncbi:sphingomyelin phosphodiesterase 4 isoform X2 [Prorops nasuta]|uniref:sphingomyelin phosphodiesterase 4 isoform X2 n=1 Tax=Prorops nasuta TaxID=863751 RepID=UPI0034CD72D6